MDCPPSVKCDPQATFRINRRAVGKSHVRSKHDEDGFSAQLAIFCYLEAIDGSSECVREIKVSTIRTEGGPIRDNVPAVLQAWSRLPVPAVKRANGFPFVDIHRAEPKSAAGIDAGIVQAIAGLVFLDGRDDFEGSGTRVELGKRTRQPYDKVSAQARQDKANFSGRRPTPAHTNCVIKSMNPV